MNEVIADLIVKLYKYGRSPKAILEFVNQSLYHKIKLADVLRVIKDSENGSK
jgi:hypothetical protein